MVQVQQYVSNFLLMIVFLVLNVDKLKSFSFEICDCCKDYDIFIFRST
jgi:hypothetical protein